MTFRFARITLADLTLRIKNEIEEFHLPIYQRLFRTITTLNANTVQVTDYIGRVWTVERHTMFFCAPAVQRADGTPINTSHLVWLPTISAAKWLERIIETCN